MKKHIARSILPSILLYFFYLSAHAAPEFPSLDIYAAGILRETAPEDHIMQGREKTTLIPQALMRSVSNSGINFIKQHEGTYRCPQINSRHCPYNDAGGYCTIGYGHLISKKTCEETFTFLIEKNMENGISDEAATKLLKQDLTFAQYILEGSFENGKLGPPDINENQYDALTSFIFNVGGRNYRKSTLLKTLKVREKMDGNEKVSFEFSRWIISNGKKIEGLKKRRENEIELFFSGFNGEKEKLAPLSMINAPPTQMLIDISTGEK